MKSAKLICAASVLSAALALPLQLAAQHTRYKFIDIGTLGGAASYLTDPGFGPGELVLNNRGDACRKGGYAYSRSQWPGPK